MNLPPAIHTPCSHCPWRRESLAGWLGPLTTDQWLELIASDEPIACHQTIEKDKSWDGAFQCAGAASFRANICKSPRDPEVARGPRRDDVFASRDEFRAHHRRFAE